MASSQQVFVYHYCAFRVSRQTGERVYMDDVIYLTQEVSSTAAYLQLKSIIAEKHDIPETLLTITSLSKLCVTVAQIG
ncbi:hypothetical protein [Acinetobacter brisouii]|uniref:hypothetical protein n=1 Tax=Acinetobacter brisouii TaxID=396323 RepID=UPI00124F4567|nr:hypothetical protein [Acinetobacter brisouii]